MKNTIKILLLTILLLIGIAMTTKVEAASASIKASKTTATVGDSVTITVTINAAAWNLKATGSGVSGGTYVGYTSDAKNATRTETLKLDTSTSGSKTIVLSGDVTDGDTDKTTTINSTVTVVVNDKSSSTSSSSSTKSSDATLKSVTINGSSYTIGKTKTVSADTTSVTIKATPNSSKATVSGTGTKELVTGTNKFTLKVTAENGTTKSYTITIVRKEYVDDTPNIIEEDETEELLLTSLKVEGAELIPEFSSTVFEYIVYVADVNEVQINAIANKEDTNIEITGNTDLIEGENTAIIKLTKDDKTVEYKITINKSIVITQDDTEDNEEQKIGLIGMINNWWNSSGPTSLILVGILALLGAAIVFAITSYKYSNTVTRVSKHSKTDFVENNNLIDENK